MRLILGIIIGIALTVGGAYIRDTNLPSTPTATADASQPEPLSSRPMVNWDVVAAVTHDQTTFIRTQWNKMFH